MSDWKPIETAPKDETLVLLFFPDGYWATGERYSCGFWCAETPDLPVNGGWFAGEADDRPMNAFGSNPTHWMELPTAPMLPPLEGDNK